MDVGSLLPPKLPNFEAFDKASGQLMTMREFYGFRAENRKLTKQEGDDYFTHQRIVRQYMVYNDHLLVIHDAGTGKTRTTLGFLNEIVNGPLRGIYKNVVIATPSELLHKNWENNPEIQQFSERLTIEYTTHSRLSRFNPESYPGTFFVLDEAHQATGDTVDISFDRLDKSELRNIKESRSKDDIYRGIWNILHNGQLHKVLILTATPMQNSREDFYSLINLILPIGDQIMTYEPIPDERMLNLMSGRVSYVRSAEEGIDIEYGLSEPMERSIAVSRLLSGVGKLFLGYIYNIEIGKRYFVPGCQGNNQRYLLIEFMRSQTLETSMLLDLFSGAVVWRENYELEPVKLTFSPDNLSIIFDRMELGNIEDIDVVFSVSTTVNSKLRPAADQTVDIVETFLSASQSLYFSSRLDEIKNKPLEEKGLSISNNQLIVIDDPINGLLPMNMYHISNLFSTIVTMLLLSLPLESREGFIRQSWREFIADEVVEPGKNILFSEYVESSVGGIQKIGELLSRVGYLPFKISENKDAKLTSYGKAPRFILNPKPEEIDFFNDPENWDGSYIQLSLYSSQGAKGVSYKDVRHIHLIPHWSPAENTQALFRGIRAKSHDNLRSRIPEGEKFEVRIYKHISTPLPSLITYNNQWVSSGVKIPGTGIRYFGESEDQGVYIPVSNFPSTMDEVISYENKLNDYTRVLTKEVSDPDGEDGRDRFIDFQFTINGFAMQYVPNPTTHPNINILGNNLKLPKMEGYPEETNETFYSPIAYKLTIASRKDIEIAKMRLLYKQAAMDCDLNKKRNILPSNLDGTEWCEYTSCDYVCLPGMRGLEIIIDTIDPQTGEDVRWERDDWVPLSQPRVATSDVYTFLSDDVKRELLEYTVDEINSKAGGYVHIYRLVLGLRERFGKRVSEPQYMSFLSEVIYSNTSSRYIRDLYKNYCTLKTQGSIIYLCPMYDSERKLYITPEGQVASRFMHGSSRRLFSNQGSWNQISRNPPSRDTLRNIYRNFMSGKRPGKEVEECFALVASQGGNFDEFVRVIEGAYIDYLESERLNPITERFSKFFLKTTLDKIDKILDPNGNFITPRISPWKVENKDRVIVHFHLLYHMHPFFSKVKKPISENTPIKMMVDSDPSFGFFATTQVEQQILYGIAEEDDRRKLFELSDKSKDDGKEGIIGIFDDKKFIDPVGKDKMEYFKIYVPVYGKTSPKHPQGKVCTSYSDEELRRIAGLFLIETGKNKIENCKLIYQAMINERRIR